MSENKDIQKVENDKDKIEYEKFHWEISAIKRFNICIVIIVLGIFICALFNISYKINEHNKACAKKFDSLTTTSGARISATSFSLLRRTLLMSVISSKSSQQ